MEKKMWEVGVRGNTWRMMKKMTGCAKSTVMLDGEISNYVDILQGVAQGCTDVRFHLVYSMYISTA